MKQGGELSDRDRIRAILAALKVCDQQITMEAMEEQFRRETGRSPDLGDVQAICKGSWTHE